MFERLGQFVARYWFVVIAAWAVIVAVTLGLAPRWDDVTYDGDLAYMPESMSSVHAERVLEQAFPGRRSKSEMVLLASRDDGPLEAEDVGAIDRLAARLHNLFGVSLFQQAIAEFEDAAKLRKAGDDDAAEALFLSADAAQRKAISSWDEALRLDPECGEAYNNRAYISRWQGNDEAAERERRLASDFVEGLKSPGVALIPADVQSLPILDIWTRHTDVVGSKLRSQDRQAEMIVVRLAQEFMATDNIRVLERIESVVQDVTSQSFPDALQVHVTGSAAVGGDMLRSAAESIANTETYTVVLVLTILVIVYRSPLLVAVPLATILVSVAVAMGCVAALTQLHLVSGFEWWNFKIFTTTRIFVVVILFGAGTDFCLFLISRYKEELDRSGGDSSASVATALAGVGDALTASALTTIVGLSTMFFADFGKFRNSGPAIGLCLAVTLAACLTLAPALLRAFGTAVFWPMGIRVEGAGGRDELTRLGRFWDRLSRIIVAYPGRVLVVCILLLSPMAVLGTSVDVTYDFLSELAPNRPSKVGAQQLERFFDVGETGPIVLLAKVPGGDLDSAEGQKALAALTADLYRREGVRAVRSMSEPRGDKPSGYSLKKAALRSHEITRSLYLSKRPELGGDVARFEVLLDHDPFSLVAIQVLNEIDESLQRQVQDPTSYWSQAEFSYAGTTSAIRDLREVTRRDNIRIQVLVVLAVLAVLLIILRRPVICFYLILSVLFSYYVTMGVTEWFFQYAYGDTFQGLDWKVPLFLFVILVAIGQDYNIYLATRVFEEQETNGLFGGLRRAIVRTGGIITSCGIIMAGTFVSMTTGTLRGMVELGFALSLGVMLDTFVVRPVLVPAFMALLFRAFAAKSRPTTSRAKVSRPHSLPLSSEQPVQDQIKS